MQKDWFFSAVLLFSLFLMVGLGMVNFGHERSVERETARITAEIKNSPGGVPRISDEYRRLALLGIDAARNVMYEAKFTPIQRAYAQNRITKDQYNTQIADEVRNAENFRNDEQAKLDAVAAGTANPDATAAVVGYITAGVGVESERSKPVQAFNLLFTRGLLAMDAAMFSLIGFFILSAAYRAFRIRSIEASILMATALMVLLMFVPLALKITSSLDPNSFAGNFRIDSIGLWLLSTINVPAIRAIDLGLGLGLLAMALRIILGLERGVAAD